MPKSAIGVYGLAVMGRNLAQNIESRGFPVSVFNRSREKTDSIISDFKDRALTPAFSAEEFIASLEPPRKVILMVKAGSPVDEAIALFEPYLEPGDLIIDGGNSHFPDTIRRAKALEAKGLHFLGCGISGGEEGALKGPAIMPGGSEDAYALAAPILSAIAAKVENAPCCAYIGADGAGHFVKMVHNGIEYGDMQLICEAYDILRSLGVSADGLRDIFNEWNKGELDSYLIEITADILGQTDEDTGLPVVDIILDSAGQKGTGLWTAEAALRLGVPCPTLTEAVYARCMSALKSERIEAAKLLPAPAKTAPPDGDFAERVRRALYLSKICAYAQGFALMRAAAEEYSWALDYGSIAMVFRGGCIIRARFLSHIKDAYTRAPGLFNLLLDDYFKDIAEKYAPDLRYVAALCCERGIPAPAFTSALSYFDSYRSEYLPANLLQAQRDYFGAHTFERTDKPGVFHRAWF